MEAHSIDDKLVRAMADQANGVTPTPADPKPEPVQAVDKDDDTQELDPTSSGALEDPESPAQEVAAKDEKSVTAEADEQPADAPEPDKQAADSPIDQYGNPVAKPRMYTEDELNQKIRERLSRGRQIEQPQQQQYHPQPQQQAAEGFQPDPNSEETWEVQLERFIDNTIQKREAKQSEKQWQDQQQRQQAEFESKFSSGMNKYQDFHKVLEGKPITDTMMMAARTLDDPAAFFYSACKLQPAEIARIAQIADPYAQAVEVGRLDLNMRKTASNVSKAPKPLDEQRGDMPVKQYEQPSLDQRIASHAKQKNARR